MLDTASLIVSCGLFATDNNGVSCHYCGQLIDGQWVRVEEQFEIRLILHQECAKKLIKEIQEAVVGIPQLCIVV